MKMHSTTHPHRPHLLLLFSQVIMNLLRTCHSLELLIPKSYHRQNHRVITRLFQTDDDVMMSSGLTISGYKRPVVNWYPGHIAKAERMLAETLRSVDVVLEVRDARAPKATAHPKVGEWAAGKPRLVILTKGDLVPPSRYVLASFQDVIVMLL